MNPGNCIQVQGGFLTQRNLVHDIIRHCIEKIMPFHRTLWIEVTLNNLDKTHGLLGLCMDGEHNEFELEIDKNQKVYDLILTVCHEMAHVKQASRREHVVIGLKHYWHGQAINTKRHPWEKEAVMMEKPLAHSYIVENTDLYISQVKSNQGKVL